MKQAHRESVSLNSDFPFCFCGRERMVRLMHLLFSLKIKDENKLGIFPFG
jgi:hypothetical protein